MALTLTAAEQALVDQGDTLPRLFLQRALRDAGKVAMRRRDLGIWQRYTWADCYAQVQGLAHGLHRLGLRRGDSLCILADNCPEWVWTDLAAGGIGVVAAGIYATNTAEQVAYIVRHCGARVAVAHDEEQLDKLVEARGQMPGLERVILIDRVGNRIRQAHGDLVVSWAELAALGREDARERPGWFVPEALAARPDDVATLVYTSGTTGPPKGVMLSHRNQVTAIRGLRETVPLAPGEVSISFLPLCHIMERSMSITGFVRYGYTLHFGEGVETIQRDLVETAPTLFVSVPRIWEKMHSAHQYRIMESTWLNRRLYHWAMGVARRRLDLQERHRPVPRSLHWLARLADWLVLGAVRDQMGLGRTRFAMSGGAPIDPEILRFFAAIGVPITEGYGMTEATGGVALTRRGEFRFGTVGRVLSVFDCRIAEDGEVLLRGDTIFRGYLHDPEATARAVVDGWLHTGDLGELSADGYLRITDRKKDILITAGGKNVAPQEIENRLKVSPFIKEAIVIGDRRPYVVALIQIDFLNTGQWAEANGIEYTTFRSLAAHPAVHELVAAEVERANATLGRVEQVKRFQLLDRELDQDDGELTATQKVRRKVIADRYGDLIERLYARV